MDKIKVLVFGSNKVEYDKEKYIVFYINNLIEKDTFFSYQDFAKNHTLKNEDVVVSYLTEIPLDMRLLIPQIPYDILVICTENKNIDQVMQDREEHQKKDYDLYSGKKIETDNNKIIENIKKNIKDIYNISIQMMEAGYLDLENNKKIEDWIIMFQDPFLQMFVEKYQPETSNDTMTVEDEFLDNANFRATILQAFLKVISNFFINNNYIDMTKLSGYTNWYDQKLWQFIKEQVEFL